ncbi:alpha/beta hydrolase [uncultured Maricaulis sp.]|mgnify:FL=1|uniref:alpha/beta fold hydrolase n=1 Tax=uncultured Maricaulis sp. TaxID=174710 RepID=UPI0030DBE2D7|tara:strand:+ start:3857 stop:4819 length:963 start_codon:yes stop_codon:yes gene_type:complete
MTPILVTVLGGLVLISLAVLAGLSIWSRMIARRVEAAIPPAGEIATVTGGKIHFLDQGEGRPIVMIHGLAGHLQNFTHSTTDALKDDFRVIALDRPGSGYSARDSDEQARIPEQARMIAEFLAAKGIEKPLIVGHSLGGAVALTLALNHPDSISGIALIAPLAKLPEEGAKAFDALKIASPFMRRLIGETLAVPMSIRTGDATLRLVFGPNEAPADFRLRGGGLLGLRPRAFVTASTDYAAVGLDMPALTARFSEIKLPVGVIYGDSDRILDAQANLDALRTSIPQLDEEVLPGIGHMVQINRPDETEAFIRRMATKSFS